MVLISSRSLIEQGNDHEVCRHLRDSEGLKRKSLKVAHDEQLDGLFSNGHLALQFVVPQMICESPVSQLIVVFSIQSVLFFISIHIFDYLDLLLS